MTEQDLNELTLEDAEEQSGPSPLEGRQAFRKISRELTEQDLANAAVQKLLLSEIDRLEKEKEEYKLYLGKEKEEHKLYVERFHEVDKKVAVLEQKSRTALALDIVFGGCLAVGSLLLGLALADQPDLALADQPDQPFGWIGGVTFIIGIVAKAVSAINIKVKAS